MNDPRTHQHLADRLSAEAASLSIADTPVEVVVARGRQRQHRRDGAAQVSAKLAQGKFQCHGDASLSARRLNWR